MSGDESRVAEEQNKAADVEVFWRSTAMDKIKLKGSGHGLEWLRCCEVSGAGQSTMTSQGKIFWPPTASTHLVGEALGQADLGAVGHHLAAGQHRVAQHRGRGRQLGANRQLQGEGASQPWDREGGEVRAWAAEPCTAHLCCGTYLPPWAAPS